MEEKEELLNEKKYQKTKGKIALIAFLVFCIGVSIGGYLIGIGLRKSKEIKAELEARPLSVIEAEMDDMNNTLASLKAKNNKEFKENGFTEEYYKTENEIDKINEKLSSLKSESWNKKNGYGIASHAQKYIPFYVIGGFIIFTTLMISGQIYLISKGREIFAYTTQQTIPVAKEGIEKMAPTMRKVSKEAMQDMAPEFGEIAKEIAKGIKEGKEDEIENK